MRSGRTIERLEETETIKDIEYIEYIKDIEDDIEDIEEKETMTAVKRKRAAGAPKEISMLQQRMIAAAIIFLSFFIFVKIQKPVYYPRSKNVQAAGRIWQEDARLEAMFPVGRPVWPAVEDELLILVNSWNFIPADRLAVNLAEVENGYSMDERCREDLQNMMNDCRGAGLSPLICSAYRTQELQETLFWRQVDRCVAAGYSQDAAYAEAARSVAIPGTSEHQLGLAVDIVDSSYQRLNEGQENTPAQQWLMANCWRYGFILRYPREKVEITGVYYEPWHYRYVGKDAASQIYLQGVCLEEYLSGGEDFAEDENPAEE